MFAETGTLTKTATLAILPSTAIYHSVDYTMVESRKYEAVPKFLRTLEHGQVCPGVVSSIERFGVFVDLGDADGLISMINLSWRRFEDASEIVQVGQNVAVVILDIDLERERLSLSLKALQDDPWIEIARTRLGEVLTAPVTKIIPIGTFVAVAEGIEGFIHISDFRGEELPSEGQNLTVRITDINLRHHRIRLALV
ncbi:S1 RNA-binding domain-containing protein [Acrocarpospora pleiomorpha]|nr:S1 RNA-binding domain-containing protein [Acrocarpospora pleiomorpha]